MAQLFAAQPANDLPKVPNYNVCPTTGIHVVYGSDQGRRLVTMRWGFVPDWYRSPGDGPLLINARAETIAEKPAFAEACRRRRCLIPATGFYEWTKSEGGARLPWYIHRRDGAPIAFAGVWQSWGQEDPEKTCAIVTTAANDAVSALHRRMPLILEPEDWALWLGEKGRGAARLMQRGAEETLIWHRVSPQVNANHASGCDLIEPFDDAEADSAEAARADQPGPLI